MTPTKIKKGNIIRFSYGGRKVYEAVITGEKHLCGTHLYEAVEMGGKGEIWDVALEYIQSVYHQKRLRFSAIDKAGSELAYAAVRYEYVEKERTDVIGKAIDLMIKQLRFLNATDYSIVCEIEEERWEPL